MCGIVGYIGSKKAQPILLNGLKRLEYRGYDSAGIVTIGEKTTLVRAKGKVTELGSKLQARVTSDTLGIGHTRWATHGAPLTKNAHPHRARDIYLVHNGIIENYQELKSALQEKGVIFESDTDSEVLAWVIASYYQPGVSLVSAVTMALHDVVGAYGIAVVSVREPDKLVVARNGSPLIAGLGNGEVFIASDASALVGHVDQVIYLNDGEIAVCSASGLELSDLEQRPLAPQVERLELDTQTIQKQGYDHFLLKEIMEQPATVESTLRGRLRPNKGRIHLGGLNIDEHVLRNVQNVIIVGCGTAFYSGLLAGYILERVLDDVHIESVVASEFRYRAAYIPKNTVALIVSQSGETADTLACLREIKNRGVPVLGVVNAVGSTIAREVDGGIYLHVGPEISVASTKAFTSQVVAMLLFGLKVAELKGVNPQIIDEIIDELGQLPDQLKKILNERATIKKVATKLQKFEHALYLGRDRLFPIAMEGALKLKEISYIHAEGYPAGELKHGPIALIDDRFFIAFLLLDDWLFEKGVSNLAEVQARHGRTVVFTNSQKKLDAQIVVRLPITLDWLAPLCMNVAMQLLAYDIAVGRDTDVDQPRNLAKSVTVE